MKTNRFTKTESADIIKLEQDLAYFYNARNPETIASHYIEALQILESSDHSSSDKKILMLEALSRAYQEVKAQTQLTFNPGKVASLEYDLIIGQQAKMPYEELCAILISIYELVYGLTSPLIDKAASLRTFLYQYKVQLLNSGNQLTREDVELLMTIDLASKRILSELCSNNN